VAKLVGADDKTVASVRQEMQTRGEAFAKAWDGLNQIQRQEFVTSRRRDISSLLGFPHHRKRERHHSAGMGRAAEPSLFFWKARLSQRWMGLRLQIKARGGIWRNS
jgi:hypothetical protein